MSTILRTIPPDVVRGKLENLLAIWTAADGEIRASQMVHKYGGKNRGENVVCLEHRSSIPGLSRN